MTILTPKRFTIEEYHRLAELGFFTEDDRVELIRGEIIEKAVKSIGHINCCRNLLNELAALVAGRAELQCQDPIILPSHSEPEPDFAIVRNRADNYVSAHPRPSDVLLLIEISDSTLQYDQDVKISLYAEAGISDYWIFNLVDNHLEAYSEPYQDMQGRFGYAVKRIILPNQTVALSGFPDLAIDLSKVFPRMEG